MCERPHRLIGHVHTTPDIFETTHFPLRIRVVDGALNRSGERFQNCTVSMSGFVRTDGQFVSKSMLFQKYPDSCGCTHTLYEELADESL